MEAKATLEDWMKANSVALAEAGVEARVNVEAFRPDTASIHLWSDSRSGFCLICGKDGALISYWEDAVIEIMREEQEHEPEESVDEIMAKGLELVKRYPNSSSMEALG